MFPTNMFFSAFQYSYFPYSYICNLYNIDSHLQHHNIGRKKLTQTNMFSYPSVFDIRFCFRYQILFFILYSVFRIILYHFSEIYRRFFITICTIEVFSSPCRQCYQFAAFIIRFLFKSLY